MIPPRFEYHAPKTVGEAVALLGQLGSDAKLLAGGHSLLPMMKLRFAAPEHLIDINRIKELEAKLAAEQERCAKVAQRCADLADTNGDYLLICDVVAAIRKEGK